MQTRIILIRHGETNWNVERCYLSRTDIDINDTGRMQVLQALDAIKEERVTKIYSSDRKRALNSSALLFTDMAVEKSPQLREMDFGIFEGLRYDEIAVKHKDIYDRWINDPRKNTIPEGESFTAFETRVMGKIKEIVSANPGKSVAVVTHGGVVRLILSNILKPPRFWDIKMVKPGTVTIIESDRDFHFVVKRYEPDGDVWPKK
jgi:broad specificity phosphatase PhoE